MSLRLAGLGWVTPLGSGLDEVWQELCGGAEAEWKMPGDLDEISAIHSLCSG